MARTRLPPSGNNNSDANKRMRTDSPHSQSKEKAEVSAPASPAESDIMALPEDVYRLIGKAIDILQTRAYKFGDEGLGDVRDCLIKAEAMTARSAANLCGGEVEVCEGRTKLKM